MTRRTIGAAGLVLAMLAPAQAQPPRRLIPFMPPVQYDHPFDGKVYVVTTSDRAFLTEACPAGQFKPPLACAFKGPTGCVIVFASAKLFEAQGMSVEVARRHERGHCNGWPSDHSNSRTPKQAGPDVDATLGTSLIGVPDDEFIVNFRAQRERMRKAKEAADSVRVSPASPPTAAKTIAGEQRWPEPDLLKNILPTK